MGPDWSFLGSRMRDPDIAWQTVSSKSYQGSDRSRRFRMCRDGALAAKDAIKVGEKPLLISHLPNVAGLTNVARRVYCPKVPQLAFAFNFTTLPKGIRKAGFQRTLHGIDEFVVFSRYEKELYSENFGIAPERLHFLKWAMDAPKADEPTSESGKGAPYICAIGGEARDYDLFAKAMKALPHRKAKVVARPYSISGIDFPENVEVATNLSPGETWRIATDSLGMALPLLSSTTTCGHITFVAAQLLGIPLVATECLGLSDYISPSRVFRTVPSGNLDALVEATDSLFDEQDAAQEKAQAVQEIANVEHNPDTWVTYMRDLLARL